MTCPNVSQEIRKEEEDNGGVFWGYPQEVKLPFACKPRIKKELDCHTTGRTCTDDEDVEHIQFVQCVKLVLTQIVRRVGKKSCGTTTVVGGDVHQLYDNSDDKDTDEDGGDGDGMEEDDKEL